MGSSLSRYVKRPHMVWFGKGRVTIWTCPDWLNGGLGHILKVRREGLGKDGHVFKTRGPDSKEQPRMTEGETSKGATGKSQVL